jgi:hypothetical protein
VLIPQTLVKASVDAFSKYDADMRESSRKRKAEEVAIKAAEEETALQAAILSDRMRKAELEQIREKEKKVRKCMQYTFCCNAV